VHYYQHNIKDFNNATRHLTRVERCSYRDAIELYYDTEKPLISDLNQLARKLLCLTNDEKDALKYVLSEFFYLVDGFYHHTRCDFEIDKFHNTASAKARAGKASADSRRKKKESKIEQKATGAEQVLNSVEPVFEHNPTNQQPLTNNHKPLTINQEQDINTPTQQVERNDKFSEVFDFWKLTFNKTNNSKLTPKRINLLKARFKEGYQIDDMRGAITGCANSAHHMGKNDTGTIYDSLELIFRSGDNIEKFIGYNSKVIQASKTEQIMQHNISLAEDFING